MFLFYFRLLATRLLPYCLVALALPVIVVVPKSVTATMVTKTNLLVGRKLHDLEWWQETVVYQVYPRSFQDSNGDGTGDLKGIKSRLDYLVNLGVGAVWFSPIYKSPMADFGYDISNFTDIDPAFGTMQDFKELVAEMQTKGIKVIMDFIPNHSSDLHEWFIKSITREEPYTDYYTWRDPSGWSNESGPVPLPPNNWVSVFGGSMWEWNELRQQFYLHQFAKEQPDLNLENPEVSREMLKVLEFWIDMGVDGFRMDAVPHMFENQTFPDESKAEDADPGAREEEYAYWDHRYTFDLPKVLVELAKYRQVIDNKTKEDGKIRVMMTEGYVNPLENLMKYYGTPEAPIAHFPFNFELIGLRTFKPDLLKFVVDSWMDAMPEGNWANWLVGNHDTSRVSTRFGSTLVDAINMVVLLLPGTAVTYYGEELGMQDRHMTWEETKDPAGCNAGPDRFHLFSRDPERTPMQWDAYKNSGFSSANSTWLPVNENYTWLNVEAQLLDEESHLKVYKTLMALRKSDEWKYGGLETKVLANGTVFGFTRVHESSGILVLANLGSRIGTFNATAFKDIGYRSTGTVYTRSILFSGHLETGSVVRLNSIRLAPSEGLVIRFQVGNSNNKCSTALQPILVSVVLICTVGFLVRRILNLR